MFRAISRSIIYSVIGTILLNGVLRLFTGRSYRRRY
jgi:hypothetical protein